MTMIMKKHLNLAGKMILSIACAAILTISGAGSAQASDSAGNAAASVIGAEAAQNFAFADAGTDPLSVDSVYTEYDYDDGEFLYDVEFTIGDVEYEYQVQAYDGSILKKSIEYPALKNSLSGQDNSAAVITLEEAKEIALANITLIDKKLNAEEAAGAELTEEAPVEEEQAEENQTEENQIGEESVSVTFTKEELDYDDGVSVYDIEFYTGTAKYEYEISALTGDILELSVKYGTAAAETTGSSGNETASDNVNNSDNTGGSDSSDSSGTDNSDNADGSGSAAASAAESGVSDSYISLEEAKSIALNCAGFSASDVTFTKAKLEWEHGMTTYEIEFYHGGLEYECEINAVTGAVIEFEVDD